MPTSSVLNTVSKPTIKIKATGRIIGATYVRQF
jgi:hypothetical protein